MKRFNLTKKGFSILEVILAVALFVIFSTGAVGIVIQGYNSNRLGVEYSIANQFASEGIEVVRSIKNQDFTGLVDSGGTGVDRVGDVWVFAGSNNTLIHNISDNYERVIKIEEVQRDGGGNIVSSGGTVDLNTKKITSTVSWNFNSARPESISLITYLTNWSEPIAGGIAPPTVTTDPETLVTSTTVTLNGTANPNGDATTGWFRYSQTNPVTCNDTFGTRVPLTPPTGDALGSGTTNVPYSEDLTNLTANTPYFYCAIASNAGGITAASNVESFTTSPVPEIEFIASTTSTGNNPTSGSFSLPVGWQIGDVAVFWWYTANGAKTITPPGTITEKRQANSGNGRIYIGYRVLLSGDTSFSWTSSSQNNSTTIWGTSIFRNVNTSSPDPFEAESGAPATFANTSSPNPPAVTTLGSNAMVIPIFGKNNDYSSITAPTNYTSAGSNTSTAGNPDASAGAAYFKKITAGFEDPGTWSAAGASGDDGYVWTGVLKPN